MADIASMNGVAAASIAAVNGVAKAAIAKLGGVDMPASGASLWCLLGADGAVGTAAASDLNAWVCYVSAGMSSKDYNNIAYGKDGSGNPLWVAVNENGTKELRYASDPTAGIGAWSNVNLDNAPAGVGWGNNVWLACGGGGKVYRSTSGTTGWSLLDLSGVTGWASDITIYEIVSDGAGNWMFAQGQSVFSSTDDGSTWARVVDFTSWSGTDLDTDYKAYTMAYNKTSARWLVFLRKTSNSRIYYAAAADTSAWTGATVGEVAQSGQALGNSAARRMASGGNTVIIGSSNDTSRSTNGGADWTKNTNDLPRTDVRDFAADGNGNWVAVHDSGRVSISTNDGDSWAEQTGVQQGANTNMRFPTGGSNVENLDAVAADVFLPV